jgi:hypothetical protein
MTDPRTPPAQPRKGRQTPKLLEGQVVWDEDLAEYVNFVRWSYDFPLSAYVFNPRCGEKYRTKIRPLTPNELGLVSR